MTDDFPFDDAVRFTEADDQVHAPGPEQNWTETSFWSFHIPERCLGGWLYVAMRPNIGTVAGGAFVYDASSWLPWEAPYYVFLNHQPLPDHLDLRDASFPTGVSVKCLAPGMRYALRYRLPGRDRFTADLQFAGLTPPVPHLSGEPPFTSASHYDQHGSVTGSITLDGEMVAVDCISVRDRSWGPRPEVRDRDLQIGYCFAASSEDHGFLAFTMPRPDQSSAAEHLFGGYLLRNGVLRPLSRLTRTNVYDGETGGVAKIHLEGNDTDGRSVEATGIARSRTSLLLGTEVAIMSCIEWEIVDEDGPVQRGWGEDQSVYPNASCRARRLARR